MSNKIYSPYAALPACLLILIMLTFQSCVAQKGNIPMDKVLGIKWMHSHEEDKGDLEVYRPDAYEFPPARGRRGFKMLKDNSFINYEIAPADGTLEREGKWEKVNDHTFAVLFGENDKNRNYKLELVSYKKNRLKVKIIRN